MLPVTKVVLRCQERIAGKLSALESSCSAPTQINRVKGKNQREIDGLLPLDCPLNYAFGLPDGFREEAGIK
jgi:hypothetical protein